MGLFDRFVKKGAPAKTAPEEKMKAAEKTLQDLKKEEGKADAKQTKVVARPAKEDTGSAYRILVRPVITEKSAILADQGQFVFEVYPMANKIEVAKAVKMVYGVHPVRVNFVKLPAKSVNQRFSAQGGKQKIRRKAIVTLKKGERIPLFEGV